MQHNKLVPLSRLPEYGHNLDWELNDPLSRTAAPLNRIALNPGGLRLFTHALGFDDHPIITDPAYHHEDVEEDDHNATLILRESCHPESVAPVVDPRFRQLFPENSAIRQSLIRPNLTLHVDVLALERNVALEANQQRKEQNSPVVWARNLNHALVGGLAKAALPVLITDHLKPETVGPQSTIVAAALLADHFGHGNWGMNTLIGLEGGARIAQAYIFRKNQILEESGFEPDYSNQNGPEDENPYHQDVLPFTVQVSRAVFGGALLALAWRVPGLKLIRPCAPPPRLNRGQTLDESDFEPDSSSQDGLDLGKHVSFSKGLDK